MREVRISRTARLWDGGAREYVLSVDLPLSATKFDVAAAVMELDRIVPHVEGLCPRCGTAFDTFHRPECPLAPDGLIESLRREALEEGMRD